MTAETVLMTKEEKNDIRAKFVDTMEDALIISNGESLFLDANEKAKKLFPYLNALESSDPLPEKLRPLFFDNDDNLRLEGRFYVKKVRESRGNEDRIYLTLHDDTENENRLREMERNRKDTEEKSVANFAFLANVSHEIRTPMNAIVGMADIISREEIKPELRGYLDNIKVSADMLLSVVNDFLDLSKIKDGTLKLNEEEYEPMSIIDDLSMMFLNRIGDKNVELIYSLDREIPTKLFGDSKRIKQILVNMVNNSVEFTDDGFICLTIKVEEKEDDNVILSFSVEDSGRGIKEEDKADLFTPFNKKTDRNSQGIGLTICRQLVDIMGGEIGMESTYGSGSRFFFTLSQRIVDPTPAAILSEEGGIPGVYYTFDNTYAEESFLWLTEEYGVRVLEFGPEALKEIMSGKGGGYLFTDNPGRIGEANRKNLAESGIRLCILKNPFPFSVKDTEDNGDIYVTKPLYSLNFCQILNDTVRNRTETKYELEFTAPDARILIVDDNEMNIQVAKGLLAPLKMQIDTADNGKTGVECVLGSSYDIIFMDHMMPVMDGIEALERIRTLSGGNYEEQPVIALSANATAEAEELFREKGFNDFIAKPIRIKELIKCILKWLPEEKIRRGDGSDERRYPEEEECLIPDVIEGINVELGINYCGSPPLFIKCLDIFYRIIDKKTTMINNYLEDALIRDLTVEVHALKNSSRMIGAEKLSEDFKELERLGNEGDLEALKIKVPPVLELYQTYKGILKPFSDTEKKNFYIPKKEEVIENLKKIIDAMDSFDMDGADEAMSTLRDFALPGNLNDRIMDLDALVSDFAMEDVIQLSGELIEECTKAFAEGESV